MINPMGSPGARSCKSKVDLPIHDKLEDRYKDIGDVWTTVRGHELFLFHYLRKNEPIPISNPWNTCLGKLVVPNIFISIDLLKLLVRHYNIDKQSIFLPDKITLVHFLVDTI